jgi:hypothetical protein
MSPQMNGEERDRATAQERIRPADSDAGEHPLPPALDTSRVNESTGQTGPELAPLFSPDAATDFRTRWDSVQRSFVDDPKEAVHAADQLVSEVTQSLADRFAAQRADLEGKFARSEGPNTENLRLALREYRSFFDRLLSL